MEMAALTHNFAKFALTQGLKASSRREFVPEKKTVSCAAQKNAQNKLEVDEFENKNRTPESKRNSSTSTSLKKNERFSKAPRKERERVMSAKRNAAACYGCGAELQTENEGTPGYVQPETYKIVRYV